MSIAVQHVERASCRPHCESLDLYAFRKFCAKTIRSFELGCVPGLIVVTDGDHFQPDTNRPIVLRSNHVEKWQRRYLAYVVRGRR